MDDPFARLEIEYCPPIDAALFSAIVSEYNLDDHEALQQVCATLDVLKETAVAEEATGFDPSGSSAQGDDNSPGLAISGPYNSGNSSAVLGDTDLSSLSNGVSSIDLASDENSASAVEDLQGIERFDNESKARLLRDLFPSLSEFTVSYTLKKHQYRWRQSLDDMLNQVYLIDNDRGSENGDKVMAKGIEAFSESNIQPRGRKKKRGKKLRLDDDERRATSLPTSTYNAAPTTNKWQTAAKDVEFIATHLRIPTQKVSSVYYQQNASMQRTIASFLESWLEQNSHSAEADPTIQVDAYELGQDFPTISDQYRVAIIGITQPSTVGAHEIAQALATQGTSNDGLSEKVIPQYVPLRISEDDDPASLSSASEVAFSGMDFGVASSRASTLYAARSAALSQARAAYRKSKSDHLMGAAAAYYSQVGRDLRESSQVYTAAAADSLVASQSSATHIDLHGVTVDDALRITRARVNQWWSRLGESKYNGRVGADERANGFQIVTGAGKHSKGGRGVLGPAVKKLLEQDGWRIESMSGGILVKGKARSV